MPTVARRIMELPREVLELIISQGLDSCQTSISWMQISSIFRKLVLTLLGVVVLQDGVSELKDIELPFDYKMLMHKSNTLYVNTDHPRAGELLAFIKRYSHLVIVVQTNRNYSDVLGSLMAGIAQDCCSGATICIVYSTLQNYLSKLYFRGISMFQQRVRLSELHVVGNSAMYKSELFDINTLFERTFLYHLRKIYSLDVQSMNNKLISQDLKVIKQLNFANFDDEWYHYFAFCPNLKKIEDTKFPLRNNEETFKLPRCESIALTHYVDGPRYQPIDGSQICEELALVPTLRSVDCHFHSLYFAKLKKLRLVFSNSESHNIRFRDCDFRSLSILDCGLCLIPWSDLQSSGVELKQIKLAMGTSEQIQWLLSCPYNLEKISIVSQNSRLPASPSFSSIPQGSLNVYALDIEIRSLWHCYLFHHLVFQSVNHSSDLKITLDLNSLMQSMLDSTFAIEEWGLPIEDDCMAFKVPQVKHFTLTLVGKRKDRIGELSTDVLRDTPSVAPYPNIFFDTNATLQNYAVSPSTFRRKSLAGLDSDAARRQSTIAELNGQMSYPRKHRSSSSSSGINGISMMKACVFLLSDKFPEVITTNIAALDEGLFSWSEIKTDRIFFLRVVAENLPMEFDSLQDLAQKLSEEIIDILKYPYHIALRYVVVEKFQVIVDLSTLGFEFHEQEQTQLKIDLQLYLAFKGHNVKVFTPSEQDSFHVSVLLKF